MRPNALPAVGATFAYRIISGFWESELFILHACRHVNNEWERVRPQNSTISLSCLIVGQCSNLLNAR